MKRFALFILICFISTASGEKIQWLTSYDQALALSKQTSKPIYLDCFAEWCSWCHQLDDEVYNTPRFAEFLQNYIPLRVNIEDNGEGTRLAEQLKITGLPTMFVLDSDGKVLNRIGGYLEAEPLIQDLRKIESLLDRERKIPGDPIVSLELANEYLARDMHEEAEMRFEKILKSETASSRQKEEAQFSLALSQYYQHNLDRALASVQEYRKDFADGPSSEDALLLQSEIYLEMDQNDQARASLREFLRKYPASGNVHRAREVLSLLDVHGDQEIEKR